MAILDTPLTCGVIWLWLTVCAVQDWRHREVSNWLTIPALVLGLVVAVAAGGERLLLFVVAVLIYGVGTVRNRVGGADFKIAAALGALWPAAFVAGHVVVFVWGIVAKIKDQKVPFVVPLMLGATLFILTGVLLPSIMISKDVMTPAVFAAWVQPRRLFFNDMAKVPPKNSLEKGEYR